MAESDATTKQSARYRNKYIPNKVLPRERISNKKFAFEQLNHRTGSGYRTNCCNNDDYATTVTLVQVSQRALRTEEGATFSTFRLVSGRRLAVVAVTAAADVAMVGSVYVAPV